MTRKTILPLLLLALSWPAQAQNRSLDTTSFVVVGGALSAGYCNFQLVERYQKGSYAALMAESMETVFPLPLFSPLLPAQSGKPSPMPVFNENGRLIYVAFNPLPNLLPAVSQSVLRKLPFPLFTFNLSIPFVKVSDTLRARPSRPFVREGDLKQTFINTILGYPEMVLNDPPIWSQIEYAELMAPTFAVLELGFGDVLEAALAGDPGKITPAASFASDYDAIAAGLQSTFAEVLLLNVPDPTDTAYFSSIAAAAALHHTSAASLMAAYGLQSGDLLTLAGLLEIGQQLSGQRPAANLSANSVLRVSAVTALRSAVQSYNATIASVAQKNGFLTFDLNAFYKEAAGSGIQAGSHVLAGGYLRGFFSRDGIFPAPTAHAVLANRLLNLVNTTYRQRFPLVDVDRIAAGDELVSQSEGASVSAAAQTRPSASGK